jgi:quercetin dioxygenase-like cupin family protein
MQMFERLATAMVPHNLSIARRQRLRSRIINRARDTSPAGTYTVRADAGQWRIFAPGVSMKVLRSDAATHSMTALIRMQSGARLDTHCHHQTEECLVLEGEICIGNHRVAAGDLHVAKPGVRHDVLVACSEVLLLVRSEIPPAGYMRM